MNGKSRILSWADFPEDFRPFFLDPTGCTLSTKELAPGVYALLSSIPNVDNAGFGRALGTRPISTSFLGLAFGPCPSWWPAHPPELGCWTSRSPPDRFVRQHSASIAIDARLCYIPLARAAPRLTPSGLNAPGTARAGDGSRAFRLVAVFGNWSPNILLPMPMNAMSVPAPVGGARARCGLRHGRRRPICRPIWGPNRASRRGGCEREHACHRGR